MRLYLLALGLGLCAQSVEDAAVLSKRAAALAAQSRHEAAIAEYERALAIYREKGDRFQQGVVLNNLAASRTSNGDPDAALALLEEAMRIRESLNDQLGVAYTLLGIANVHWFAGEPQKALDTYRRLVAQAKVVKNDLLLAHALNNGGLVLQALGEDANALSQHQQALAIFKRLQQRLYEGYAINNAGMAAMNLGQRQQARGQFNEALQIFRELTDPRAQAYPLHNLGDLELKEGRPDAAIPFYRQSLEQKRSVRDRYGEAWSLARLAEANAAKGDNAGAHILLKQALHLHRTVADRTGEASTLALLGRVERSMGNPAQATQHLEEAMALVERTRNTVATPELRGSYFATRQSIYEYLTDLLVERKEVRALEIAERSRARLLLDNLAGDPKLEAIQRSIHALGQRLQRASALLDAEAGRERLRQLELAAAKFPAADRGRPRTVAELRKLTKANSVMIAYWLGDTRSAVFVVRPEKVTLVPLPPRKEIEQKLGSLLSLLTARGSAPAGETVARRAARIKEADGELPGVAAAIGKMVWPERELTGVSNALVVPHHALARLPFWLLPGTDRVRVTVIPSASMLPFLGTRSSASNAVAVYAAPQFGPELPPLPFARAEGEAIGRLAAKATVRTGVAAQNTAGLGQEMAAHRYIHFATHVELGKVEPRIELTKSRLTLANVYALTLDADLVTLSGCRTALGEELNGEGLMSFTHAFLFAGANRVLATLWNVDDQATAAFMQQFYTALLTRQRTPAEALADAREALRKQPRYQHPWYWAGFALHGQWR
jgi:tetratricopeptide (TPR) repeat protein